MGSSLPASMTRTLTAEVSRPDSDLCNGAPTVGVLGETVGNSQSGSTTTDNDIVVGVEQLAALLDDGGSVGSRESKSHWQRQEGRNHRQPLGHLAV